MRHVLWLAPALWMSACEADISFVAKPAAVQDLYPLIDVVPPVVDFGSLASEDLVTATFTITNPGYEPLQLDSVELLGHPSFEMVFPVPLPVEVLSGAPLTFDVSFRPTVGGDLEAKVVLLSNADNTPEREVDLLGAGALPQLRITPPLLDLGERLIPCGTDGRFVLTNVGSEPLDIQDVFLEGEAEDLEIRTTVSSSRVLREDESWTIPIAFDPSLSGGFQAKLAVQSNDPRGVRRASIEGAARYAQTLKRTFDVEEELPLDIVFAIDQSCSMGSHQDRLNTSIAAFVQKLDAGNAAWRLGVLTELDGCFRKDGAGTWGFVSDSDPNWKTNFQAAAKLGDDGNSLTERLLQLTAKAFTASCNAGFRHPGAPLHVIVVSDERDQSSTDWSSLVTSYQVYASQGGAAPVRVHAVVDLQPNSGVNCSGPDGGPGGYLEAAAATGGKVADICENTWPAQLGTIADQAIDDLRVFKLGQADADPNSLVVTVNGAVVQEGDGWVFDASDNALVFDVPPPGGTIVDVEFGVALTCR